MKREFISTVYIGGGTPTVLRDDQIEALFRTIASSISIAPGTEWTIEANPNSMKSVTLEVCRQQGANRLSIGIQSFSADILAYLGRSHDRDQSLSAIDVGRRAGFANIGVDLIYGIPGQTVGLWRDTLRQAIDLGPDHISIYSLSLDTGSALFRRAQEGTFSLPDDGTSSHMYQIATDLLYTSGYEGYELSNFSRPGYECRHNLNYWDRGEYLGIGPSAWSFVRGIRTHSVHDIDEYAHLLEKGLPINILKEEPTSDDAIREHLLLGLRMARGIDLREFQMIHGTIAYKRLQEVVKVHEGRGMLENKNDRLRLTSAGRLLADEIILRLIP